MRQPFKTLIAAAAGLAAAAMISTVASAAATVTGAGSTAIYPVLSVWAQKYNQMTGVQVNYQSIGSGGGIKQIESKTVDFGATDKPLEPKDLDANDMIQFPQVIISIVPAINLPGFKPGELVIDGPTLANIYLGKITMWNDPALKKLNPGVNLPDTSIVVVHRSDGSGTTFNFTNYLGKVSPDWAKNVGSDTSVAWPTGIGGKGNAGVAAAVQQATGSIGYVEFAYAMQNNLTYMDMINSAGKHVKPTMEAFQASASNADFSKVRNFYLVLTDQPGATSWPITGTTWVLLRKDTPKADNEECVKFFDWALKNGQADAEKLDYVPIPASVVKQIEASWQKDLGVSP